MPILAYNKYGADLHSDGERNRRRQGNCRYMQKGLPQNRADLLWFYYLNLLSRDGGKWKEKLAPLGFWIIDSTNKKRVPPHRGIVKCASSFICHIYCTDTYAVGLKIRTVLIQIR